LAGNRKLVKVCENRKQEFTQFEWALSRQCLPSDLTSWTDLETTVQIKSFGPKEKEAKGDVSHFIRSIKKCEVF